MSKFENVSVIKKANIYFDGGVTSRTVLFPGGEMKTLGIMQPGEYKFDTSKKELMEIQTGTVKVRLANSVEWLDVVSGGCFEVPANSAFDIKVSSITDYCCSFIEE
jgi:uncharacterized protein YaiE (UPF0345 family)